MTSGVALVSYGSSIGVVGNSICTLRLVGGHSTETTHPTDITDLTNCSRPYGPSQLIII